MHLAPVHARIGHHAPSNRYDRRQAGTARDTNDIALDLGAQIGHAVRPVQFDLLSQPEAVVAKKIPCPRAVRHALDLEIPDAFPIRDV